MLKRLKSTRAEAYVDVAISLVVLMMVIVLALNVFSFLTLKVDMDYFAREMIDVATVAGRTDSSEITDRYNELVQEMGISPSYSWNADYFQDGKVQYGESIQVNLSLDTQVNGFGVFNVPITLTAAYSGLSQQYWK